MLSMLISDSRFDLVWFRLSCDHGWIRSGSVNVRKQQQKNNIVVGYVLHILPIGPQPYYPVIYVVANPVVRGLLDMEISEEHLQSSNESI